MPVVGLGDGVPGPVGVLEILEDDPGVAVFVGRVAPDVEIPPERAGLGLPGPLEPGVLVGGVVDHQLGDDADAPPVGLAQELLEIRQRAVIRMDVEVIGNVVAVVAQGRGIERQQPEGGHPQFLEVVELLDQALEIADAVAVAVVKGLDVHFVDDGIFVPERIIGLYLCICQRWSPSAPGYMK